jgi:hypothetical protein
MHRLETIDRAAYAELTGMTGHGKPGRSEAWAMTENAVRTVLSRASTLMGFSMPPVIRQIASALGNGQPVAEEDWNALEAARLNATLDSASQRPGHLMASEGPSPYARAFHNVARTAELLGLWRTNEPQHAEIAYLAAQIATEAQLWPTASE